MNLCFQIAVSLEKHIGSLILYIHIKKSGIGTDKLFRLKIDHDNAKRTQ
jgi:hypothetical protein